MTWKFLKQKILFPKGLKWAQHWVSRIGLWQRQGNGNKEVKKAIGLTYNEQNNNWTLHVGHMHFLIFVQFFGIIP